MHDTMDLAAFAVEVHSISQDMAVDNVLDVAYHERDDQ